MPLNGGCSYREVVGPAAAGQSVLAYLANSRRHSSIEQWRQRVLQGEVELDGARAEPTKLLRLGQLLVWHRPPWMEEEVPGSYSLIFEDDAVVAVIKPRGLPTMPGGGFLQGTLLTLLRAHYPEASPMHRLGRETSGVLLFARTQQSAASVAMAWRSHEVVKQYRALGSGVATWETLDITARIGPVPHPVLGTIHAASDKGKTAHSVAQVMERRAQSTLFRVNITTGRPHQIRIHLAFAGHPLVGDPLYAAGGLPLPLEPGLPGDGGYFLHAERLVLAHPVTGRPLELFAPPPPELELNRVNTTAANRQ